MSTAENTGSGGGILSKLIVVVLLALAIGLYLRVVLMDGERPDNEPAPQASVRVIEGNEPAPVQPETTRLKDLPANQMRIILQVFAPEMLKD